MDTGKETDVISVGKGLTRQEVTVITLGNFDMEPHPTYDTSKIDEVWECKLKETPGIFNGLKFRLHSISLAKDRITLELGMTSYKEYLGTSCGPYAKVLQEDGQRLYQNKYIFMSEALAVGGLVLTSDDKFIILHRSNLVSESKGKLDRPGGHAEPEMVVGYSAQLKLAQLSTTAIVDELFDSIKREIVDEVNIPDSHLEDPLLIGICRNNTTGGRASFEFLIKCTLSSNEVIARYNKGEHVEAEESVGIHAWTRDKLFGAAEKNQDTLAPAFKGAIQLYKLME